MASETLQRLKCLKVDSHNHIIPRDIPDWYAKYGYGPWITLDHESEPGKARMIKEGKLFRVIEQNCFDPEERLKDMDAAGVDVQVLCTIPVMFSYWAQPEHCLESSQFLNDHIAEVCAKYPKRFIGYGTLPMQAPELAIQELRRCVNELGFKGIQIGSHVNDWNLDDPNLFPIFEECEKLDCAVFVHPWDMMGKEKMEKYWLPWLVGMPAETSLAVCSMIFGGVFERLPNLRVCFGHGGGSFPITIGRIEHGYHCRPDLVQVDSILHDHKALHYVVDLMGEDFVIFGTDYPFPLGEVPPWSYPGQLIETSPQLSDEAKVKLLEKNLFTFLKVNREAYLRDENE